jgi:hypothetical protein
MQKILKLQHHKHTGALLAHEHTSFRGLALLLIVFACALIIIQKQASADSLIVTGKVAASVPTQPAVITLPLQGATLYGQSIAVQGTCEFVPPASVVVLQINGQFAGSTSCNVTGTFTIVTLLSPGVNSLVVRTMNITNDYGPDSAPVSVTLLQPAGSTSTDQAAGGGQSTIPSRSRTDVQTPQKQGSLEILSKTHYLLFGPQKPAAWAGFVRGGTPPYAVTISWGDERTDTYTVLDQQEQQFTHTYGAMKPHYVTITARDKYGLERTHHLVAVTPFVPIVRTEATPPPQTPSYIPTILAAFLSVAVLLSWYDLRIRKQQAFVTAKRNRPVNTKKRTRMRTK